MASTELLPRPEPLASLHSDPADDAVLQQLAPLLTTIRRHLHMHPEVGGQEYETAAFIREMLEMHGLEVHGPVAGTGLYVDIEGTREGPWLGYRADIDALPIADVKRCDYASQRAGFGHLCGHDAHTAIGIGVALLLDASRDRLRGGVRVFFQPNEEGFDSGAPDMIRDGVLDGLAAVYGVHVDPTLEAGRYGIMSGPITAAADRFRITVRGPGTGHSARPHLVVDTIQVATQICTGLYQLVGRVTDARNASVLTICRMHGGGEAYNVIPDVVEFGGTLRSTDPDDRARIKGLIRDTAERVGQIYGATIEAEILDGSPPVINDEAIAEHIAATIEHVHGPEALFRIPRPSMGSEDFAHYTAILPGAMMRVGTASSPATSHPLHDSNFDLDEAVLGPAAHLMTQLLLTHGA